MTACLKVKIAIWGNYCLENPLHLRVLNRSLFSRPNISPEVELAIYVFFSTGYIIRRIEPTTHLIQPFRLAGIGTLSALSSYRFDTNIISIG